MQQKLITPSAKFHAVQRCDVGLKSLIRTLCKFFRERLISFRKSLNYRGDKTTIEDWSEVILSTVQPMDDMNNLFCTSRDVAFALRVLLSAKSTAAKC